MFQRRLADTHNPSAQSCMTALLTACMEDRNKVPSSSESPTCLRYLGLCAVGDEQPGDGRAQQHRLRHTLWGCAHNSVDRGFQYVVQAKLQECVVSESRQADAPCRRRKCCACSSVHRRQGPSLTSTCSRQRIDHSTQEKRENVCTCSVRDAEDVHHLEVSLPEWWSLVVCSTFGGGGLLCPTVVLPWTMPCEPIPHVMGQPCV